MNMVTPHNMTNFTIFFKIINFHLVRLDERIKVLDAEAEITERVYKPHT